MTSRTRIRHGAHRTGRGLVAALTPSLLAVAAVAALITALAVWQAEDRTRPPAATAQARSAASAEAIAPATTTTRASTGPTPSAGTSSPGPGSSSPEHTRERRERGAARFAGTEVVVLNQTSRRGLAAAVGDHLRDAGWTVPAVGNFTGVVPSTTVYYPAGLAAAARAVAADLPVPPRTLPRFGNLSTTRLTVVVTDTYPS